MSTLEKPAAPWRFFAAAVVLLALGARLIPGSRTIDDAYITFRYARNLLAGEGLVYNAGERVLGTTTPLYAALLAGAGLISGGPDAPFPTIAPLINAAADALTCLLFLHLGRRLGLPLAGAAAALAWAVLPFSVTFAIGGLETSVFTLLLTALAAAHIERRHTAAALLAALSLLTRPDAALLLAPLGLDRLFLAMRRNVRPTRQEITAFSLPLAAWLIPATLFYGSPIPHSIAAKVAAYTLQPDAAFTRLVQHYATPFMDNLAFGPAGIAAGLVLYPFLALVGARRLARTNARTWPWSVFPWIWFAAYALANPLIFRWYLTPPLPAYIFAIFAGAAGILQDLERSRFKPLAAALRPALLAGPALLLLNGWTLTPDHGLERPAPEMAWYALELKYLEAAEFLNATLPEAAIPPTLAAADIGALGYATHLPILDTLGLISPEAVAYYPTRAEYLVIAYAVAPELILDLRPDYIVLLEVYGREGLFKNPEFVSLYEPIRVIETDIYGSEGMWIFQLR